MDDDAPAKAPADTAGKVAAFYEHHPYPPPEDDIVARGRLWDDQRRRADACLFWPNEPYRANRSILVAGCGTVQAARYAMRWPRAEVVGIDVSAKSIAFTQELKRKHALDNLEVRQLPIERVSDLGRAFDQVVCTGVLHHLPDPDAGLRALSDMLGAAGAMHLMVYAPYGRAGVYMIQDYCRRLGVGFTHREIGDLATSLKALPMDHPLVPLLRHSPDFTDKAALADALLHPCDRAYSVPELLAFLDRAGLAFGRWVRQAPYLPFCGAVASTPHAARLAALPPEQQFAALELFRGIMVRHGLVAYRKGPPARVTPVTFEGDEWLGHIPVRIPDALALRERLPPGAAAVLVNTNHTFNDLYLPIDTRQLRLYEAIDGQRTIAQICRGRGDRLIARAFFQQLWRWDQVVFETKGRIASANGGGPALP